ncbi:MAG: XdhC family protein [Anaerolineales bacterium]|nr:XdhC family protein [Anaerolineales bacterium]
MTESRNQQVLAELLAAQADGRSLALATVIRARGSVPRHAGAKMLMYEDGRTSGTVGGGELEARVLQESLQALAENHPRVVHYALVDPARGDPGVCGGELEVFVEPYLPQPTLFIVGCGHVGQAIADLAHWLGYRVAVTDDRAELATPAHVPHADVHLPGAFADALAQFPITRQTYVVVVTRNVAVDRAILPRLVATPAPYIGVMGSQRRWAETRRQLLADGLTEADLARFHSPIGLELNAETPAEIAVSIMAEVIMLRRGGSGARMS